MCVCVVLGGTYNDGNISVGGGRCVCVCVAWGGGGGPT